MTPVVVVGHELSRPTTPTELGRWPHAGGDGSSPHANDPAVPFPEKGSFCQLITRFNCQAHPLEHHSHFRANINLDVRRAF
jgi:hypothetical protein